MFDQEYDKESLIGTFDNMRDVAEEVVPRHDNFGILADLSHFPLLGVEPEVAIPKVSEYLTDFHLGTCVLEESHPAFGDKQPNSASTTARTTRKTSPTSLHSSLTRGFSIRRIDR